MAGEAGERSAAGKVPGRVGGVVRTQADAADPHLRGRTYDVPFEDVWQAARSLVGGGQRGWTLVAADDQQGVLVADATVPLRKVVDSVRVVVSLDADARTRVDVQAGPREGAGGVARNARRIRGFLKRLDHEVPVRAAERRARAAPPSAPRAAGAGVGGGGGGAAGARR